MKILLANKIYILAILLIAGMFYWSAYRPAKIKHDCSWIEVINPALSAQPAITKEEVKNSEVEYSKCIAKASCSGNNGGYKPIFCGLFCDQLLKKETPALPALPKFSWYRKANKTEYNFCIHEKGL